MDKDHKTAGSALSPPVNPRGAGILMHITSLHSPFGIGDVGKDAFAFADFLHQGKQKYWQILPLTPVDQSQGYSPYSASASMAGNTLLISLELLKEDRLLTDSDIHNAKVRNTGKVNYGEVEAIKRKMLNKAYEKFRGKKRDSSFIDYCETEAHWLTDFSAYVLLKEINGGNAWFEWPSEYKNRNPKALSKIHNKHPDRIEKVKWQQFIFHKQWQALRRHCHKLNISLVGDLPFYVSYDSADVWANQDIFSLDENGKMKGVAGVPPDYFNSDGQLWGMPVFNWTALKKSNYEWWLNRLLKNTSLYDVIRLDHFRAFADYWEVPANEQTAKNGKWNRGPRNDFFRTVRKSIPELPFIAEDLGDIDEPVYALRDRYKLPGMKVLQFAFGDKPGESAYTPHNHAPDFIVYTGTHDNNTTRGWFRKDMGQEEKRNLSSYTGKKINEENVHIELARLAYSSVCRIAIIPMQDILGLDEEARMNTPASVNNNWSWRMRANAISREIEDRLIEWTALYKRY
jgi:4-alpha-glucanotransferase